MTKKNMYFIDLFAGIGGFHLAFNKWCKYKKINAKCLFVSEIDENAKKVYELNFKYKKEKIINIRDIKKKDVDLNKHEILFAGFPCQTFSNAGNKKGFEDSIRGTLFFDIVYILKKYKPKYFLLENVKHLINHDSGRTWNIITNTLKSIGYNIPDEPLICSPHEFGIPQDRKRVFIPGIRNDIYIDGTYDNFKNNILKKNIKNKKISFSKIFENEINSKYFLKNNNYEYLISIINAWDDFIKNIKRINGRTLPVIWIQDMLKKISKKEFNSFPNWKQKYIKDMKEIYNLNKDYIDKWVKKYDVLSWKKRDQKLEWHAGVDCFDIKETFIQLRQSGIRCKKKCFFPTLVAIVQVPIIFDFNYKEWRFLTPRENANLQSFPKKFKIFSDISKNSNSDFISYKQFGNSINVLVVYFILKEMLEKYE